MICALPRKESVRVVLPPHVCLACALGLFAMSKRPLSDAAAAEAATAEAKKFKSAIDTLADEFLCPITSELPVDPVMAEDGRVYERSAIEEWFATRQQARVKSPITNELMGKKLLPAVQVRNNIKAMVQSGAISGEKADAWNKRLKEERKVEDTRKRAEGGDAKAMVNLVSWYGNGSKGLTQDFNKAFEWSKKAADLDHPPAIGQCGMYYLLGAGVGKNVTHGFIMLGRAAEMGSDWACVQLGDAYANGRDIKKDLAEAAKWYRRMGDCKYKNVLQEDRDRAAEWLRKYESGELS